jgi:outer membrane lipoprotein-sorting protein
MRRSWMSRQALSLLLPLLAGMSGCLYHTRKLEAPTAPSTVLNADASQLVEKVNQAYDAVHSMSATVDMQASVGGSRKGEVTDYTSFRGFILLRKPEMLRVLGLLPIVRTPAFDLVSDGDSFKLLIPPKDKAVVGKNSITTKSPNPLMNFRPSLFFDSMLIREIGPQDEVILTTDSTLTQDAKTKKWFEQRDYLLSIVQPKASTKGTTQVRELIPKRVIRFSRADLQPIEQDVYDQDGTIETQTLYGPPQTFGDVRFPGMVTIKRPLEEYQIVMTIQKLILNQPLGDDQFELKIPDGVQIQRLD